MTRILYPDWKYKTEMYLGRRIESGHETEYLWELYDMKFSPIQAASELQFIAGGSLDVGRKR